mgnify:CR=1 FL=1
MHTTPSDRRVFHFEWTGTDVQGQTCKGQLQAQHRAMAHAMLQRQGVRVETLRQPRRTRARATTPLAQLARLEQVSQLLSAQLPLLNALDIMLSNESCPSSLRVWNDVRQQVMAGQSLHSAMRVHQGAFGDLVLALVATGEATGTLAECLDQACQSLNEQRQWRQHVRTALRYPLAMLGLAVAVVGFMLGFVLPHFAQLFASMGQGLPGPTLWLLRMAEHAPLILTAMVLLISSTWIAGRTAWRRPVWRARLEAGLWRLPALGSTLRRQQLALWALTLGRMLQSGMPLSPALALLAPTSPSLWAPNLSLDMRHALENGSPVHMALPSHAQSPALAQVLRLGASVGQLAPMLLQWGLTERQTAQRQMQTLLSGLQPLLMLGMALMIGGMLLAMYLPIFQMGRHL